MIHQECPKIQRNPFAVGPGAPPFIARPAARFRVTVPAEIDVKAIRAKLKITRAEFARRFGIPVGALEDWEQGRGAPDGAARVLLKIIDREPAAVERALGAA